MADLKKAVNIQFFFILLQLLFHSEISQFISKLLSYGTWKYILLSLNVWSLY